jgi:hypothetical protein
LGRSIGLGRVGVAVVLLIAGCADHGHEVGTSRGLIDDPAAAEVLVEARRLEPPPSLGGNRLLRGWKRSRDEGRVRWWPDADGASLDLVHIGIRDRELLIRE